jgi:HemY protein
MLRFLALVALLFAVALGIRALSGTSGELALTLGDTVYAVNLSTAVIGAIVFVLVTMGLIWFVRALLSAPWRLARGFHRRNHERAREAIAHGLVAIAAGDVRAAERAMLEATRRAPDQPLALLLKAQTAQLKGDRDGARHVFHKMTENPLTRIAGLRGLHIEAEREGQAEAAHQIAAQARGEAPAAPWAARALMRHQTAAADWDGALATLAGATDARILDRRTARRQRAVILTAKALAKEESEPDAARAAALEAHDLASDFVPAAVVAGRLLARQGDVRRATRVLETTWKAAPHPDVADAYLHVRTGDAAGDRLKRAETLYRIRPHADESRQAVARAAIDARDFTRAREALAPLIAERPTRNALILMAELEEAETGDRGRAREWLARAVRAPRDPAWTADGVVLEEWAPVSPVTGRLDAVAWKVPVAELEGPRLDIEKSELAPSPPPPQPVRPVALAEAPPPRPAPPSGVTETRPRTAARPAARTPVAPPAAVQPIAGKAEKTDRTVRPILAEPPRPDDPGVGEDDEDEADRSLPAFLRSG